MARTAVALALAAGLAVARAQNPSIETDGNDVIVSVAEGGAFRVRAGANMAPISLSDVDFNEISANLDQLMQTVGELTAQVTSLNEYKQNAEACGSVGQLYDADANSCTDPQGPEGRSLVDRLETIEDDVAQIEVNLNGTGGDHQFCSICPQNQFVVTPCNDEHQTICQECARGSYSRGGHVPSCTSCATLVDNCGFATCNDRNSAQCVTCDQSVERYNQQAYVLTGANQCTQCAVGTYRSNNQTCTPCPKADTCAAAQCQAVFKRNGRATMLAGIGRLSSVLASQTGGLPTQLYLTLGQDGVTDWSRAQLHTLVQNNPWYTFDLGQSVQAAVDRIVLYNRPGGTQCRLFVSNNLCSAANTFSGLPFDGADNGAYIGLSDTPFDENTIAPPSTNACQPGGRNCICGGGKLTTPNVTNRYELNCNGARGRYAFLFLPRSQQGTLNFAEFEVHGHYEPRSPAVSKCVRQCDLEGCRAGEARCSGDQSTARCQAGGCIREVTNGVAWGFVAATGQCQRCTSSQYVNANGVCTSCPGGCGNNCQVRESRVRDGIPTHAPRTYANQVPEHAVDGNPNTYLETVTARQVFFQYEMLQRERVSRVQVWNRPDQCAARLFQGNVGCSWPFATRGSPNDRDYDGQYEGAIVRVSDQPCIWPNDCPGTECGRITRPNYDSHLYTVTCNQPIQGQYVTVQLPSQGGRILQIGEIEIHRDVNSPSC